MVLNNINNFVYRLYLFKKKWSWTIHSSYWLFLKFIISTHQHQHQIKMINFIVLMDRRIRNLKINSAKISSIQDTVDIMISASLHMVFNNWDKAREPILSIKLNSVNHILSEVAVNMVRGATFCTEESNLQLKKDSNKNSSCRTFLLFLFNKANCFS